MLLSWWRTSLQGGKHPTSTFKASSRTWPVFCPLTFHWQKQVTRPRSKTVGEEVYSIFSEAMAGWGGRNSEQMIPSMGTSLVVQWLRLLLPMQGVRVRTLVRELRSHMPHDQNTKTKTRSSIVTNSIETLKKWSTWFQKWHCLSLHV